MFSMFNKAEQTLIPHVSISNEYTLRRWHHHQRGLAVCCPRQRLSSGVVGVPMTKKLIVTLRLLCLVKKLLIL